MSVAVEEVPLGEPEWLEYALYEATEAEDAPPHDAHNVVILRVETDTRGENITCTLGKILP